MIKQMMIFLVFTFAITVCRPEKRNRHHRPEASKLIFVYLHFGQIQFHIIKPFRKFIFGTLGNLVPCVYLMSSVFVSFCCCCRSLSWLRERNIGQKRVPKPDWKIECALNTLRGDVCQSVCLSVCVRACIGDIPHSWVQWRRPNATIKHAENQLVKICII